MKQKATLTSAEMLVWAAAFAKSYADSADGPLMSVPRAIKEAYLAVDALRAAPELVKVANEKYAMEKVAYNERIEQNLANPGRPTFTKITSMETEDKHIAMLLNFCAGGFGGAPE